MFDSATAAVASWVHHQWYSHFHSTSTSTLREQPPAADTWFCQIRRCRSWWDFWARRGKGNLIAVAVSGRGVQFPSREHSIMIITTIAVIDVDHAQFPFHTILGVWEHEGWSSHRRGRCGRRSFIPIVAAAEMRRASQAMMAGALSWKMTVALK